MPAPVKRKEKPKRTVLEILLAVIGRKPEPEIVHRDPVNYFTR